MHRTTRLLVTGAGLVAGVVILAGPALATAETGRTITPAASPTFATAGDQPVGGVPAPGDSQKEEVVTDFYSGPWFPTPVGVD